MFPVCEVQIKTNSAARKTKTREHLTEEMRRHLSCDIIHLLPEKSLSLTSHDDAKTRCSIQTTDSFSRQQHISSLTLHRSAAAEDGNGANAVPFEQQPTSGFIAACCFVDRSWRVSRDWRNLLPEDDGSRFPLCLWLLWFGSWDSASRIWRNVGASLMKNIRLNLPSWKKSNAHRLENFFPQRCEIISWLWLVNDYC